MHQILKAILEVLKGQTEPFKFKSLIIKMHNEKNINVTHAHINVLIARGKVERVGVGMYRII
jgi:hypothetical protein